MKNNDFTSEFSNDEQIKNDESVNENALMETDALSLAETENSPNTSTPDKVEKENYSPDSLKRVNKLRTYGKRYKFDVPYLEYPLTKPEKKRKRYVFLAVCLYVFAAILVAAAVAFTVMLIPKFVNAGHDVSESSPDWDQFGIISGFAGMSVAAAGVLLFGILLIFGLLGIYLLFSAKKCLNLSTATEEEMAHGVVMRGVTLKTVIAALIGIVTFIISVYLAKDKAKFFSSFSPYVILVVAGILTSVAAVVIKDRYDATKKFDALPDNIKASHLAHFDALKHVKRRKETNDSTKRWWLK